MNAITEKTVWKANFIKKIYRNHTLFLFSIEGSKMIFHSLTFARSQREVLKTKGEDLGNVNE